MFNPQGQQVGENRITVEQGVLLLLEGGLNDAGQMVLSGPSLRGTDKILNQDYLDTECRRLGAPALGDFR